MNYRTKGSENSVAVVENTQTEITYQRADRKNFRQVINPATSDDMHELLIVDGMEFPIFNRVILLVPDRDVDEAQLARKVFEVASKSAASAILLFSYVSEKTRVSTTSRRLATIAAFLQSEFQTVETRVMQSGNWVEALMETRKQGDLIACPKNLTQQMLFHPVALEEALIQTFYSPVYVFEGFYTREGKGKPAWKYLQPVLYWTGLAAIFAGFFLIEAGILRMATGANNLLMLVAFLGEIAFIWGWSSIQGSWGE